MSLNVTVEASSSLSDIYQQVNPSVVVVHTVERGRLKSNSEMAATLIGLGSGVLISEDGLVITAAHIIQVADAVEVKFLDGTIIRARILGIVTWADLALIKLDYMPKKFSVAELGNSDDVRVGDQVLVVGAPSNLEHTLTVGHISGRRSSMKFPHIKKSLEFLQTDAAINEGNSGGPIFNLKGKLIGIVTQFISQSGGSEGLGLAASINSVKELLLHRETFWSGLEFYFLNGQFAKAFNVPQQSGLLIQRIAKNSPGKKAGFQAGKIKISLNNENVIIGGDIILEVEGVPVSTDIAKMEEILIGIELGKRIECKVLREGKIIKVFCIR